MFGIRWDLDAFDQMQALIRDNPGLKAGFAYSLETLTIELTGRADEWGESRPDGTRLGNAGVLSVLVWVDSGARVVEVVSVSLEPRHRRG